MKTSSTSKIRFLSFTFSLLLVIAPQSSVYCAQLNNRSTKNLLIKGESQGINLISPGATKSSIEVVTATGAKWIRLGIRWWLIEPSPNNFQWDDMDNQIELARTAGLKILAKVSGGTPCWAMKKPPLIIGVACHGPKIPTIASWVRFVEQFSRRYAGKIDYIEVWNEPDHKDSLSDGSVADYNQSILLPAIEAIRRGNPNAKILAPAIGTINGSRVIFEKSLRNALSGRAAQEIDIISIHSYLTPQKILEFGQLTKEILNSMGIQKPIWLTEYGLKLQKDTSEKDQANYLTEFQKLNSKHLTFEKSFWFAIKDMKCHSPDEKCNAYGLVDAKNKPRPAFYSLKDATALPD